MCSFGMSISDNTVCSLQLYKVEGVKVAVVDVITWTMGTPIDNVTEAEARLNSFKDYSHNLPQIYDSAMLFT